MRIANRGIEGLPPSILPHPEGPAPARASRPGRLDRTPHGISGRGTHQGEISPGRAQGPPLRRMHAICHWRRLCTLRAPPRSARRRAPSSRHGLRTFDTGTRRARPLRPPAGRGGERRTRQPRLMHEANRRIVRPAPARASRPAPPPTSPGHDRPRTRRASRASRVAEMKGAASPSRTTRPRAFDSPADAATRAATPGATARSRDTCRRRAPPCTRPRSTAPAPS